MLKLHRTRSATSGRSQLIGHADRPGDVLALSPASTFRLYLPRLIAGPKAVIVLLVMAVAFELPPSEWSIDDDSLD
jgi:hypothetical protein